MLSTKDELIRVQERNVAHQIAVLISKRYSIDTQAITDALKTIQGPRTMNGDLGFVWKFNCYGSLGKVRFLTANNEWMAYWHQDGPYTTAKSNLLRQELTEEIKAALLNPNKEAFMELIRIMKKQEAE